MAPNGTIADSTPTYDWSAASEAIRYQVYLLDGNSQFVYGVFVQARNACSGANCSLTPGIVLPDERLLLAHRDLADERLILLNGENNPIWQRSYSHASGGSSQLLESGDYPYLILSKMITFSIK